MMSDADPDDLSPFEQLRQSEAGQQFIEDIFAGRKPSGPPRRPRQPEPAPPSNDLARALSAYITLLDHLDPDQRFTAARLADLSGVNRGTLSRILSGETPNPHDDTLEALAAAFQLTGLVGITADLLKAFRDGVDTFTLDDPTDLPPDWRIVIDQVRALPSDWQAMGLDLLKSFLLWAAWFTRQE